MTTAQLVAHLLDADRAASELADEHQAPQQPRPLLTAEQCAAMDETGGLS